MNMATTADTTLPAGDTVACRACKESIHETAPICPQCGASQRTRGYKSKVAAGLLAIFLGGLGIHRFYLGQWWGVFYLLLFWTWIPGIIALVEGIVFLVRDHQRWDAKYNEGKPSVNGEGSAGLIVGLVAAAFVGIMVLGILAAIAIPAYQDYTVRARVQQSMALVQQAQAGVEQYIIDRQAYPSSNADIGIAEQTGSNNVQSLNVADGGVIVLAFSERVGPISGETIIFTPVIEDEAISWTCREGTLQPRYRPPNCR